MNGGNLKCCGNCNHYNFTTGRCIIDLQKIRIVKSYMYCREGWEFDNLTSLEREEEACEYKLLIS